MRTPSKNWWHQTGWADSDMLYSQGIPGGRPSCYPPNDVKTVVERGKIITFALEGLEKWQDYFLFFNA
jgi:hypothetical protein